MSMTWGILGPEKIANERRTRTLGLGAAVRAFNDLAVPGMGNVYFGKQLVLALLGVHVARIISERREGRVMAKNIETANAIEALACRLGFEDNKWNSDIRLRGRTKMLGKNIPAFAEARRRSFYVTQPMRMATTQPLLALQLVEAGIERFNAFSVAEKGMNLINALCDDYGSVFRTQNVVQRLCGWASGDTGTFKELVEPLSPLETLRSGLRQVLRSIVVHGDDVRAKRRKAVLSWVEGYAGVPLQLSDGRPTELDNDHWNDVESGGVFFAVRDAAVKVLDAIEENIGNQRVPEFDVDSPLPDSIEVCVTELKNRAQAFVDRKHDHSPAKEATQFCNECMDTRHVIGKLVKRDDRVLRLSGTKVIPGPAFHGLATGNSGADPADEDLPMENDLPGSSTLGTLSRRIHNMHLFAMDLQGSLSHYLENQRGGQ